MAIIDIYFLNQNLIIISLELMTLLNVYFNPFLRNSPISKLIKEDRYRRVFFWIYSIILILSIYIFFFNLDVGDYNNSNQLFVMMFILFNLIFNLVTYFGSYKFSKKELFKSLIFLVVIWIFLISTLSTSESIYFRLSDSNPDWKTYSSEFTKENITYNVSFQAANYISTNHGFFIDSPLILDFYDGYIRFNEGNISSNSTINLKIELMPYASEKNYELKNINLTYLLNTENTSYYLSPPEKPFIISYHYSGIKQFSYVILIDGSEFTRVSDINRLNIEGGNEQVQFEFSRAVMILTYWTIFLGLAPLINQMINWFIKKYPSKFIDENEGEGYV